MTTEQRLERLERDLKLLIENVAVLACKPANVFGQRGDIVYRELKADIIQFSRQFELGREDK